MAYQGCGVDVVETWENDIDSREFYQFVNKLPPYYDSLKDSELEKFLCIQTWMCKPESQKMEDFNQAEGLLTAES